MNVKIGSLFGLPSVHTSELARIIGGLASGFRSVCSRFRRIGRVSPQSCHNRVVSLEVVRVGRQLVRLIPRSSGGAGGDAGCGNAYTIRSSIFSPKLSGCSFGCYGCGWRRAGCLAVLRGSRTLVGVYVVGGTSGLLLDDRSESGVETLRDTWAFGVLGAEVKAVIFVRPSSFPLLPCAKV